MILNTNIIKHKKSLNFQFVRYIFEKYPDSILNRKIINNTK